MADSPADSTTNSTTNSDAVQLVQGDVELILTPSCGGGIAAFRWRGIDIMRPAVAGAGVLGLSNFPLVPFSNRIAQGRFAAGGRAVQLSPNLPGGNHGHALHGFGWQSAWTVAAAGIGHARLVHVYRGGEWPWAYRAEQLFQPTHSGFVHRLTLRNYGDSPMPAGLGLHPYFPRTDAVLDLAIAGRWDTDAACLPTQWQAVAMQPDWFGGAAIDNVFTGRTGPVHIRYPGHMVTIHPADDLSFTVVYVPPGQDYFCVEPVSHLTDSVNRSEDAAATGLRWLAPGETWETGVRFAVAPA